MKILVLGAAFDPPHLGHKQIVESVIKQKLADKVILVPCKKHPFAKIMSNNADRINMARDLVGEQVELSEVEMRREGISYAYDTLVEIKMMYPNDKVRWLMGSDLVESFDKWYKYEQILREFGVLVYPRAESERGALKMGMEMIKNVVPIEISSTKVREVVKQAGVWKNMVSEGVAKYIEEHNLYATESS